MGARGSHVKLLQKLWHLAKEQQLDPQDLRNETCLSNDKSGKSAWQMVVEGHHTEILEELLD